MALRTKKVRSVGTAVLVVVSIVAAGAAYVIWAQAQRPSADTLTITPVSHSVSKGAEVAYTVWLTSSAPIDTVTATLQYDTDLLKFKRVIYDNTPFNSQIPETKQNSTVTLQVAKLGGDTVKGKVTVAKVLFTGQKDGSASPQISAGNAAHAGTATNPQFGSKIIPVMVIVLSGVSLLLLTSAGFVYWRTRKKSLKGQS